MYIPRMIRNIMMFTYFIFFREDSLNFSDIYMYIYPMGIVSFKIM